MTSLQHKNSIILPILIGLKDLQQNQRETILINSLDFQIDLVIKIDSLFKNALSSQKINELICNYQVTNNKQIKVSYEQNLNLLDVSASLLDKNNKFTVYKAKNQTCNQKGIEFSFKVMFSNNQKQNKLKLYIIQQNLHLEIIKINSNVKFVKNVVLSDLLKTQSHQQKGLLTMDKQNRILLQNMNMPFPVIGFWLKTQRPLQNIQIYQHFSQFIKVKFDKKCLFKQNQDEKKYFYFVKLCKQSKNIQVYLVSWNLDQSYKKQISFPILSKQIHYQSTLNSEIHMGHHNLNELFQGNSSSQSQMSINSEQNGMNFTLRKNSQKNQLPTLQSLINYSYLSPIKQLEADKENTRNLFSNINQNSPQFSTLTKNTQIQHERFQLRARVKNQQDQINKLKGVIAEMQSQLKLYRKSGISTKCQNVRRQSRFSDISSPQSNQFTVNSHKQSNNSSPQDVRRLRQSDLKSNSISRSEWLRNSSNKKVLESKGCDSTSGSKQSQSSKKYPIVFQNESPKLKDQYRDQNLYEQLPQIVQQDARDPWEYMQIIQE